MRGEHRDATAFMSRLHHHTSLLHHSNLKYTGWPSNIPPHALNP